MNFYDFLSLKNDVNLPSKNNKKKKKKIIYCWRLDGHLQKEQALDPLVRVTNLRIRICTKMSPIWNTAFIWRLTQRKRIWSQMRIRYFFSWILMLNISCQSGLRIRIDLMRIRVRIRIQHFF